MSMNDPSLTQQPATHNSYTSFAEALQAARQIRFTMAVTQAGGLAARPLTTQSVDDEGLLWFFIGARTDLARDIAAHPEMLFVYAEPGDSRYLSVNGSATLTVDAEKARQLWSRMDAAFFPGGPEDENLRVLRVAVSKIEIWEPQGTRVGQFLKLAAAAMGAGIDTTQFGRHEVVTPASD